MDVGNADFAVAKNLPEYAENARHKTKKPSAGNTRISHGGTEKNKIFIPLRPEGGMFRGA
jgi:hypothetical protein